MEQTRKKLKLSSIVVLVFAGFSLLQVVCELLFGEISNSIIPEGVPDSILLITNKYLAESEQFNIIFLIYTLIRIRGIRTGLTTEKEEN